MNSDTITLLFERASDTTTGTSGVGAFYLDGGQCETIMVGNVFKNVGGKCIWINGGQDNVALNNIFIDSTQGVLHNDIMTIVDLHGHYTRLNSQPWVTNDIWKEAFPNLQKMLAMSDEEKALPYGNKIANNLSVNTDLINEVGGYTGKETLEFTDYSQNLEVSNAEAYFMDYKNGDYTIKPDSEIFEKLPGFEAVAFTRMGKVNDRAATRIQDAKILLIGSHKTLNNGKEEYIDPDNKAVVPFISGEGVTYVPLRYIAEVLDAIVEYDAETGLVQITGDQTSLTIPTSGTEAKKNGETITLSNPTKVIHSRTMVPLREISELFDKKVYWHNSGIISVSDDEALFDENGSDDEIIRYLHNRLYIY